MSQKQKVSFKIRTTLPIAFFLLIFLVATGLGVLNQRNYATSMRRLSADIMQEISKEMLQEYVVLKETTQYQLYELSFLIRKRLFHKIEKKDIYNIPRDLMHMFERNPVLSQIYIGTVNGDLYLFLREKSGRFVLRTKHSFDEFSTNYYYDASGEFIKEEKTDEYKSYDPRKREWYKNALSKDGIITSPVYRFFRTQEFGLTYSRRVLEDQKTIGVVSIDISLKSLSKFTDSLNKNRAGAIFFVDKSEQYFVKSSGAAATDENLKKITDAIKTNIKKPLTLKGTLVTFFIKEKEYYALVRKMPSGSRLVITVPIQDILGDMYHANYTILFLSIFGVMLATVAGIVFSRKVTSPLLELQKQTEEIRRFNLNTENKVTSSFSEIAQIGESFQRMQLGLASFKKFVPADLVRQILASGSEAAFSGERRDMTVMFMDIAGFTTISEQLEPEKLVSFLSDFFQEMSSIIIEHQGTVDKYIGDNIMSFWNAPKTVKNHEIQAVEAALACLNRLEELQPQWKKMGLPKIGVRIGIHSDIITVGNMGSLERLNYTVIGDGVNVASRLEGLGKTYNVSLIISDSVARKLPESFITNPLDEVIVKGKSTSIPVFTVSKTREV